MGILKITGRVAWEGTRDNDGHRTWTVAHEVYSSDTTTGPATALQCPGLPAYGDEWQFGSDIDAWAFCQQDATVKSIHKSNEPGNWWRVEQKFSTKGDPKWCRDNQVDDPLLIPDRISGGSVKYTEEAITDRFGNPITTSSWEQLRGPQVEFDANRSQVKVSQNRPALELDLCESMVDMVNLYPLWNMPPGCVKLSDFQWDRKFYGACYVYYERNFTFDLNGQGFARDLLDEGTKVLKGHWDAPTGQWVLDAINGSLPDPKNPNHFIRYKDKLGENTTLLLNGLGLPANVIVNTNLGAGPGSGSGLIVPCYTCSSGTSPNSMTTVLNGSFTGGWVQYQALAGASLTIPGNNSCLFTYEDSATAASLEIYAGINAFGQKRGFYKLTIQDKGGGTDTLIYRGGQSLNDSDEVDCSQSVTLNLSYSGGYAKWAPASIEVVPSGTVAAAGGLFYSGPPGVRHIEKYGPVDFTLLGIPLTF